MRLKNWNKFNESNENELIDLYNLANKPYAFYLTVDKKILQKFEYLEEALDAAAEYFNSETEYEFEDRINDITLEIIDFSGVKEGLVKMKVLTGVDKIVEILQEEDLIENGIDPDNESSWLNANTQV